MELTLDPGAAIPAFPAGSKHGLMLETSVCSSGRCANLHLYGAEVRDAGHERAKVTRDGALRFDVDTRTWQITGGDDRARAWLSSEPGAWLAPWVAENAALLQRRFERLEGQAAGEPAERRPAPAWEPGALVFHHQLYPHDFTPTLRHAGKRWMILDGCCPDPACMCTDATFSFFGIDGEQIDVVGELGERRPTKANALGKALWKAVHDASDLVDLLLDRQDDILGAGPFIVGAAYEKARLARHAGAPAATTPLEADAGYLQGGAIPEALVRRLFDVAARLHAAYSALESAWSSRFHVEIRGAIQRDGWAEVASELTTVGLFAAPGDELPWLDFELVPRDEVTVEMRQQRCALGLPLLGGGLLPAVERWTPEGTCGPPSADDTRIALAMVEALLATPCEEVLAVSGAPRVFEHHVELDVGAVDVRLTASHPESPWIEEPNAEGDEVDEDDLDEDDEDDDEDDDDDEGSISADALVEAFTDAAFDRGLARDVVLSARTLVSELAQFASAEDTGLFDERTWAAFLSDHAPRKVMLDEGDIARAPAALRAVVDWLGEVGHVEPRPFRASLDRVLPIFQQRARDPQRFGMAKALVTEMRDAGVDLEDATAIERFAAAKNAALDKVLPSSAIFAPAAPAPASVTRSPTRWSPAPGEQWPAPTDPCGCGSGRRFKKCCMAR